MLIADLRGLRRGAWVSKGARVPQGTAGDRTREYGSLRVLDTLGSSGDYCKGFRGTAPWSLTKEDTVDSTVVSLDTVMDSGEKEGKSSDDSFVACM